MLRSILFYLSVFTSRISNLLFWVHGRCDYCNTSTTIKFWSLLNQQEYIMNDAVEVATDIFPLTVEEYENGDLGIVANKDNVEVE